MQISKSDFHQYLSEYTEDEIFYRNIYLQKKEHPETFQKYLHSLDPDYIRDQRLYVPELRQEPWFPYLGENDMFANIPENIIISKHYRYTPEFTHKHDFFEILCIYDGTVSNQIQGIHHTLHTGDICIIPPNTQHSLGIFDDSLAFNIIVRASTFQSTFFQSLAADSALAKFFSHVLYQKTEGNFLIFHTGEDARIRSTLEDLYIEYMLHARYRSAFLNAQLMMLWARLLRYHENDIESILTKSSGNSSISEILNYLSQNYRTATLHDTAAHFGYSTSHFSTLIREGTGRTFLTIIKELKLSQASRALRETSLSISSICELTGYENPEHFMRLFKKTYGMTPGEYRKGHREN